MLLKLVLASFILLGFNEYVRCQICTKRMITTRTVVQTYIYTYIDRNCRWCRIRNKVKTAIGSRLVPMQEFQTITECCPGYMSTDHSDVGTPICKPICAPPCQNGICVSPGMCICLTGFTPDPTQPRSCLPVCSEGCPNGVCVGPEICKCNFGYEIQNRLCTPICLDPCINGKCVAPGTCECSPGYRKSESNDCAPYCSKGCPHGRCASPEICECDAGYELRDGVCVPVCSLPCNNGKCVAPNTCECSPGYRQSLSNECGAYCSKGCPYGKCVEPEICECNVGYQLSEGICIPVCSHPCDNGKCVGPNTCECSPGYRKSEGNRCIPYCSKGCVHGKCIIPEVCECDTGYFKIDDGNCKPVCKIPCGNGTCVDPNVCKCFPGYRHDFSLFVVNKTMCIPKCINCEGSCVGPYKCVCNPPYYETKHLGLDGKECECFENCTLFKRQCVRTICVDKVTTYSTTELSSNEFNENISEMNSRSTILKTSQIYSDWDWDWPKLNATDEEYSPNFNGNFNSTIETAYTEFIDLNNTTNENVSDSLKFQDSQQWYWIYGAIIIVSVFILILLIILFIKRKSLKRHVSGRTYEVEDRRPNIDEQQNIYEDLRYSSLLEKSDSKNKITDIENNKKQTGYGHEFSTRP